MPHGTILYLYTYMNGLNSWRKYSIVPEDIWTWKLRLFNYFVGARLPPPFLPKKQQNSSPQKKPYAKPWISPSVWFVKLPPGEAVHLTRLDQTRPLVVVSQHRGPGSKLPSFQGSQPYKNKQTQQLPILKSWYMAFFGQIFRNNSKTSMFRRHSWGSDSLIYLSNL